MTQAIVDRVVVVAIGRFSLGMYRRLITHLLRSLAFLFHVSPANELHRVNIITRQGSLPRISQKLITVSPVHLNRVVYDRIVAIEFLHHLGRETIDRILDPRFLSVDKYRLTYRVRVFTDLVHPTVRPLAFGL